MGKRSILSSLFLSFFIFFCTVSQAELAGDTKILRASEAFVPNVLEVTPSSIVVSIDIQKNYYVYRNRQFSVESDDFNILDLKLSEGQIKHDQFFGDQSVWYGSKDNINAEVEITYQNEKNLKDGRFTLRLQGCRDKVICYPPEDYSLDATFLVDQSESRDLQIEKPNFLGKKNTNASSFIADSSTTSLIPKTKSATTLLPEDQAFQVYVEQVDATTFSVQWDIAKGYYLYQSKIKLDDPDQLINQKILSQGEDHSDQFFGDQIVYRGIGQAKAIFYLKKPVLEQSFNLSYQGCADVGVCYPVMHKLITVTGDQANMGVSEGMPLSADSNSLESRLLELLKTKLWLGLLLVLFLGIPLFFTPCMLPMAPILLGIINGGQVQSVKRSITLSALYVLGMAVVMAIFGLVFSLTGFNLQFILQKPWLLLVFAGFFVLMGFAMLGKLNIGLPANIQSKVYGYQSKFQASRPLNIFIIGALSSLIVGSCATPLLFALLAIISTLNSPVVGFLALFMLGFGMGLPLIIFSAFSSKIPRTGAFSILITKVFAMLMFGVALWLLSRLISARLNLFLWALYLLIFAWVIWRAKLTGWGQKISYVFIILFIFVSGCWVYGGIVGNTNILKPLSKNSELKFISVTSLADIAKEVDNSDKPVMIDFYADWCVSCKELEFLVFTDSAIDEKLSDFTLLKLDLTDTTKEHRDILAYFGLVGPPVLLFFDPQQGVEKPVRRIVGVPEIHDFSELLGSLQKQKGL